MRILSLALLLLVGCDMAQSEVKSMGEWKLLGYVQNCNSGVSTFKRTDPDTGDVIYVTTKGGIFIVKKSQN